MKVSYNDNDDENTFIAKVVKRRSANHRNTQLNLKDNNCQEVQLNHVLTMGVEVMTFVPPYDAAV